jgi:hypothetical protein
MMVVIHHSIRRTGKKFHFRGVLVATPGQSSSLLRIGRDEGEVPVSENWEYWQSNEPRQRIRVDEALQTQEAL